jgi:hypothetical protein
MHIKFLKKNKIITKKENDFMKRKKRQKKYCRKEKKRRNFVLLKIEMKYKTQKLPS